MIARKRMDFGGIRLLQAYDHARAPQQVQTRRRRTAAPVASSIRPGSWHSEISAAAKALGAELGKAVSLAALCGSLLLGAVQPAAADTVVRVPVSPDPAIFAAQRTLLEAWRIVTDTYEDASFAGRDWESDLADGLISASAATTPEDAYQQINLMLSRLGDPFTRIIPPREFQDFRIGSDGEIQGVGLMIAQDPATRRLLVLASLEGSPAARAGVRPGDEVVSINGTATEGFGSDRVTALLRGKSGTSVTVRFARRTNQVPGVPGRPEQAPQVQIVKVMKRERLEVNPVFSTAFAHRGPMGQQTTTGYIRLVNFNMHAADDVQKAIRQLRAQGASSYILDLRKNPGGLVRAGVDIARLFLDAPAPVFNVTGRAHPAEAELPGVVGGSPGENTPPQQRIMQKVVLASSHALTKQPLALLVDGESASASEILAGALRDNGHRAVLIGDTNTYGKGKIQNVFELGDGSALFVTVARYRTPALVDIDQVGIKPDLACHAIDAPPLRDQTRASLEQLPPGLPMGLAMQLQTAKTLEDDACVLTAENFLDNLMASKAK